MATCWQVSYGSGGKPYPIPFALSADDGASFGPVGRSAVHKEINPNPI
eukprot:SAG22_NODE_6077_length_904_cov_0.986335_1_plen_47_part_10